MKKTKFTLFFTFISLLLNLQYCVAQNPTYQQKLYWTCKVWGFVKYFHSRVSVCQVNWDSVLIADLPGIKNAVTKNDFNIALDTLLNAAGPMALTSSPPCDTIAPELKRNLNLGWLNDTAIFRNDVITILDTISNNFRPHTECQVEINPNQADGGYLKFQGGDSLILNINDNTNYPDEWHRLLEIFAHWNIINYFNPYNYIQNQPWDSTLYQNILNIDSAQNDVEFYTAFIKITSNMDDEHVYGQTYDDYSYAPITGYYCPDIVLKYIPGKYVVVESGISGLNKGDEIISVNGLTTKQWEDSLKPYLSAGDSAAFHELVMESIVSASHGYHLTISYYDSLNNTQTLSTTCTLFLPYLNYHPNDTLANVQWRYWGNCNIGYMNVGKMLDTGSAVATMYSALQNSDAIIFDIRNYPASNAVFDLISEYLYSPFSSAPPGFKFQAPNVTYPGTYSWFSEYAGPGNLNPYTGKIIILFNEITISEAEFASMQLGELPNAVKIGSQTDGTDGNVTYYKLSQYMGTGFTTLGWFYPNGDSTERVGILPDSIVYPTQAGIRAGRDEVLEKALQVAGCITSVPDISQIPTKIITYPNPNNGIFTIQPVGTQHVVSASIEIYNVLGEKVKGEELRAKGTEIDLSSRPDGVYLYRVLSENGELVGQGKVVIER